MSEKNLLFGCIADDFTGAGDAASFLAAAGMWTMLFTGIPEKSLKEMPQAAVIALKTRTAPRDEAVKETLEAARWLKEMGAQQIYLKYCSTFDSTPNGNIGPTADALLEEFDEAYTVLCPALPVNGRTVREGRLLIDGVPLHRSSMRNHPLTPMWDDRIQILMEAQSRYKAYPIAIGQVQNGYLPFKTGEQHFYLIPDYYKSEHGEEIAKQYGKLRILTGGSGLISALADIYVQMYGKRNNAYCIQASYGKTVILAGSCSKATLGQIDYYQKNGGISYQIKPQSLLEGIQKIDDVYEFMDAHSENQVLIYSSASAEKVRESQQYGNERVSSILETLTARIAVYAVRSGRGRIIVAGGETSGAVTKALGYHSYFIGESIAPGVPVMVPREDAHIRLVLKSGNFGQIDFFERAIRVLEKDDNKRVT